MRKQQSKPRPKPRKPSETTEGMNAETVDKMARYIGSANVARSRVTRAANESAKRFPKNPPKPKPKKP